MIFSKSWCPYCTKTKKLFKEKYPHAQVKVIEYVFWSAAILPFIHLVLSDLMRWRTETKSKNISEKSRTKGQSQMFLLVSILSGSVTKE
jgi:hypothetical protein